MATTTNTPASQPALYLFRCRHCPFSSTSPREAQQHWDDTKHAYNVDTCAGEVMPSAPPAERLEDKVQLLIGLLDQLAKLTAEVSEAAAGDERTTDTDLPVAMLELSLEAEEERDSLSELLEEEFAPLPSIEALSEVAHG